jgi:hypothetical protein
MGFSFANLTRWVVVAGVALAAASPAHAQRAGRRPGQSILFSPTDDEGVSSNTPSLTAKPPGSWDFANAVQSPAQGSSVSSETGLLPEPLPPAISPGQARQMQQLLDERRNWALLTPEQILGLPTQEKILGIADRDAFGQPKNETVVMRYVERQDQLRSRTNTVNYGAADPASRRDFSGGTEPQVNSDFWNPAGAKPGNPGLMEQLTGATPDSGADTARTPKSIWQKSFALPESETKPTPEQQAAMNQFQELLQPHSLPGGAAKSTSMGSPLFSPQSIAPNPAPNQPAAIPMGASFTPLSSGVATPEGLTPLPGLLGPTSTGLPALVPEWKPQPPPWLSSAPQVDVIPQRKF